MRRIQKRKSAWKSILRLMKIFASGIQFMMTFNSLLISFLTVTATFVCSQAVLNIRYWFCSFDVVALCNRIPAQLQNFLRSFLLWNHFPSCFRYQDGVSKSRASCGSPGAHQSHRTQPLPRVSGARSTIQCMTPRPRLSL
jgi:hypothetical protein